MADDEAVSGVFRGKSSFPCMAMYVDFKGMKGTECWKPVYWSDRCLKGGCAKCL